MDLNNVVDVGVAVGYTARNCDESLEGSCVSSGSMVMNMDADDGGGGGGWRS